jgi:hypothetical protein
MARKKLSSWKKSEIQGDVLLLAKTDEHDADLDRVDVVVLPPCPNTFDPTIADYATLATGITPVVGSRLFTNDGTKAWDKYGATALQWNPVSTASSGTDQTARDAAAAAAATANAAIPSSQKGAALGVATLGSDQKLTAGQVPDIAIVQNLGVVASQVAMLALTDPLTGGPPQQGDWCTRSDTGTAWIVTGSNPTLIGSWTQMVYPAAPVASVAGKSGAVTLVESDIVGLPTDLANALATTTARYVSGTDTFVLADNAQAVVATATTAGTIPPHSSIALPAAAFISVMASGTGSYTIAPGAGVTLNYMGVSAPSGVAIPAGHGGTLIQSATLDTWNLTAVTVASLGLNNADNLPKSSAATYTPATGAQTVTLDCTKDEHEITGHASGTTITLALTNFTNSQVIMVTLTQGAVASTIVSLTSISGYTVHWINTAGAAPTLPAAGKKGFFGFRRTGTTTCDGLPGSVET